VKAGYNSIRGPISTAWRIDDGNFTLDVTIPANTTAAVYIPAPSETNVTEGGRPAAQSEGVQFLRRENHSVVYEIGSGTYRFVSRMKD